MKKDGAGNPCPAEALFALKPFGIYSRTSEDTNVPKIESLHVIVIRNPSGETVPQQFPYDSEPLRYLAV
jgi:hypothetical protein